MRMISVKLFFLLAFIMLILGTGLPYFINSPNINNEINSYEYSIRISGLSPKSNILLKILIIITFLSQAVFFFRLQKVAKQVSSENEMFLFERSFKLYQCLLHIAGVLSVIQIIFAISGLFSIGFFDKSYLSNSTLFDGFACLFIYISFFLLTGGVVVVKR